MTEKQGIARQKIAVIPNGVKSPDGDTTQESRDRLGVPAGAFVVGSVGRLSREKNYPLLVRAFAALRMKCPNGFLMLVGDGEDRGRIEEVAQELGVMDSCRLPGAQTDVRPWLRAMDVFCLSSDTEGMSVALLEAGALGLPAVVTDVGSNAEIVQHGVTGYVVSVGDVCAMGQVFENLHRDAGRRHQMGQAARKRIESEYSSNVTLGKYEKLYGMRWSP
jgi:glycosyltransferase involved in cell wall biosynthesis